MLTKSKIAVIAAVLGMVSPRRRSLNRSTALKVAATRCRLTMVAEAACIAAG
jgi:hypothetical protein